MDFIILESPAILIISLIAVIMFFSARFVSNKCITNTLYIMCFLFVVGCTIYALLLGVELNELLAYILIFTLLGLTAFIPMTNETKAESEINEDKKDCTCDAKSNHADKNEEQTVEEKSDEL